MSTIWTDAGCPQTQSDIRPSPVSNQILPEPTPLLTKHSETTQLVPALGLICRKPPVDRHTGGREGGAVAPGGLAASTRKKQRRQIQPISLLVFILAILSALSLLPQPVDRPEFSLNALQATGHHQPRPGLNVTQLSELSCAVSHPRTGTPPAAHPQRLSYLRLGDQLVIQLSGSVISCSPSCPAHWLPSFRNGNQLITQLSSFVTSWSPSCPAL
ncbi:hypothetical protein PCASD_15943 [Puccinia coronata f. sp. avenae]|uniref:Uncharacterized protein n=1 Tax=Puccinia coronata f. sp. avenae TaxID=200324 RepID=A0A2N5TZ95_9BASI|nr:hypothetical protein PCASD_15943 [Puccinia coronata f. sp. avenae]